MSRDSITVLLIEDNPGDARLIRETLEEETSSRFHLLHSTHLETGLERLAQGGVDVALLDLSLPDSQGIDTFNQVHAHSPLVPIVVLTGLKDDTVASQILGTGGQDILNKGALNLSILHRSIQHALDRKPATESYETKHAVEAANRLHDQFLSLLGDELRGPVTSALSTVSALMDELTTDAGLSATLGMLRRQLERQERVIDDLVAYSRAGNSGEAFRPIECEAVLEQALINLKPTIDETGAVITHIPLPTLWADGTQLVQLFQNLIGNGIRYRDGVPPRIHLAARQEDDEWVFSVRDNGIGFGPKQAERVLTIFQRLGDGDDMSGTHISLAICKKIVERHDGRIWAESDPGRVSRIFFTMPLRAEVAR